jgi:hypothetical protein
MIAAICMSLPMGDAGLRPLPYTTAGAQCRPSDPFSMPVAADKGLGGGIAGTYKADLLAGLPRLLCSRSANERLRALTQLHSERITATWPCAGLFFA